MPKARQQGFTLIELSIVLVIIGLIVGGVLVGQDLIKAAAIRQQITQINQYNTAANAFRTKCGYLPGDATAQAASACGLAPRGTSPGEGDGNGMIQGWNGAIIANISQTQTEPGLFWVDLSTAGLIDGSFSTATYWGDSGSVSCNPCAGGTFDEFWPRAKLGGGNYVYVWSGGWAQNNVSTSIGDGSNYFSIAVVTSISNSHIVASPGFTVAQAYSIDAKIDDGLPQSGNVTAQYINFQAPFGTGNAHWASGTPGVADGANTGTPSYAPTTAATSGSATTCYDNGGGSGPQQYSMAQNGGSGVNCALSFRFQ
jgi:prepilin-type N-terminal cleavage/methylation domain-containing protein